MIIYLKINFEGETKIKNFSNFHFWGRDYNEAD